METPPRIGIGEFTVAFLTDGFWRNDGGCMFGVVPRELWQRQHPPDERNRIRLNLTCPLIIKGGTAILVDTGIGNRLDSVERKIFDHGEGWLPDGLAALGMEPGDVTHVVLSHLHFDHCGGIVRRKKSGGLEPAFPRARLFIRGGELDLVQSTRNERLRAAYRHVAECVEPVSGMIEAMGSDLELVPGVSALVTGGHTVDHQVAMVSAGAAGGCFMHMADIVPTRSHIKGPWNQAFDLDPIRTMERKAHYLARAVAEQWWISFAHDDSVFAARVANDRGKLVLCERIDVAGDFSS
jgi:glyoxylase-like metal-dependent hydrolase (beta-lactamase superfamily II)